jgi:hypothetical protein
MKKLEIGNIEPIALEPILTFSSQTQVNRREKQKMFVEVVLLGAIALNML